MKVLITGAGGQLGRELYQVGMSKAKSSHANLTIYGLSRSQLDVTNHAQVKQVIANLQPDIIIHNGAYTNVDQAEMEREQAYTVNAYGTRNLVLEARAVHARIAYISTDYVFSGTKMSPYHEWDVPSPINVYGNSKLAGEAFVRCGGLEHYIIRTSWVYGKNGSNFVNSMIRMATEEKQILPNGIAELSVVSDQTGCPTYAVDLANSIWNLLLNVPDAYGTFHMAGNGSCTWYTFANAIFATLGWSDRVVVHPVTTDQIVRNALRPSYSVLESIALPAHGLPLLRHWNDSLVDFLSHSS